MVESGTDINLTDKDGKTLLHSAAIKGHLEMVKLLLINGADINAKDNWGRTPLRWAKEKGSGTVARLLEEQGGE